MLDTISGAGSQGPTGSPTGNPSGDPTGDPTEGVTEGGTTGGVQGDCGQYLQCVEAIAPESLPEVEEAYGAGGVCWQSPEATQMCLEACTTGLAAYGLLFPDEPACGGTGVEPTTTGDPTTTTDPSTTGDPSTSTTGDPSTSTTGDPSTSTTGDPSTSTTTDPSTSTTTSTTSSTTDPDTDTDGENYGNCGWAVNSNYYACGSMGPSPDVDKPIGCPANLPAIGGPCGSIAIHGITGCCAPVSADLPNGANYWCSNNIAQSQVCI